MKLVLKLATACIAAATLAASAHADAAGKNLKPLYTAPTSKPAPVKTTTYRPTTTTSTTTYRYTSPTTTTRISDALNRAETQRLISSPPPPPRVIYKQVAPQTVQRYTAPQPRPVQRYAQPSCPTYVQPAPHPMPAHCPVMAKPARPAPVAPPPCYDGHGNMLYSNTQTCPVHPQGAAYGPQNGYGYVQVNTCHGQTIERMDDTRDGRKRYSVCYADLTHLPSHDFHTKLLDRMERASDKACGRTTSVLYSIRAKRDCEEETLERSVYEAGMPGLIDTYYARTGKRRPNVSVGAPIYR